MKTNKLKKEFARNHHDTKVKYTCVNGEEHEVTVWDIIDNFACTDCEGDVHEKFIDGFIGYDNMNLKQIQDIMEDEEDYTDIEFLI